MDCIVEGGLSQNSPDTSVENHGTGKYFAIVTLKNNDKAHRVVL